MMACLLLLLALGANSGQQVIDAFEYPDLSSARRAWVTAERTAEVSMVREEGRWVLVLPAPFGSSADVPRAVMDRKVKLDLSIPGEFELELESDQPEAAGQVTLYFHSGGGWYGAGHAVSRKGWQTLRFSKSDFRTEEKPAGWEKVDGIRIAVWRTQPKDTAIRLRRLAARWHEVALVVPAGDRRTATGEVRDALANAEQVRGMLADLGLGSDAIDERAVERGMLAKRRVAILAYNPQLREETVAALVRFVVGGGKVFAFYQLPDALGQALGFQRGKYLRPEAPGQFAEIRLGGGVAGLPASVRQDSWNIITAEPEGHNAQVIGRWFSANGKATGLPALLVSDNGAYFSHILVPDHHREAKSQMLAAVLGRLDPALWGEMVEYRMGALDEIGHLDSLDGLKKYIADEKNVTASARLEAALKAIEKAKAEVAAKQYPQAIQSARQGRELLAEAYVLGQPSRAVEGRAWWNHSGTGAYPGDWERTCRELAANGFNMILPNMLWAGLAHYPSEVLPQSATCREYGDQIAQCVDAAHKYGLEVHVWKVNFNLAGAPKEHVERLRDQGRTQVSVSGRPEDWLCPSHPENLALELESMLEVARKYDVDGLHFDYIRYPDHEHCYCDGCRQRFEEASGKRVEHWPADCYSGPLRKEYRDWRCQQITRLVAAVSRGAKKLKPSIKISAAVFGSYPNCREAVGQDWASWVEAGYVDFLCPMDYTNSDLAFAGLVSSQLELVKGRVPLYPGIGCTASSSTLPPDRVVSQIRYARALGAAGFTIFNLAAETARTTVPAVGKGVAKTKAVPPHAKK